jgi:hypothetical protein
MRKRRASQALKRQLAKQPAQLGWVMRVFLWVFRTGTGSALTIGLLLALFYALQTVLSLTGFEVRTVVLTFFAFLILGVFLGVVMVTEEDSAYKESGARIRIICGVIAGSAIAVMGNASFEGIALAGILAGALGYFGVYWVKYV